MGGNIEFPNISSEIDVAFVQVYEPEWLVFGQKTCDEKTPFMKSKILRSVHT